MSHFSMLMQASAENAYVWFCVLAALCTIISVAAFLLRKKLPKERESSHLLKTDVRIARLVLILSHIEPNTQARGTRQTLRRFRYIVELKTRVAEHLPDSSSEHVKSVCSELLSIATKLRNMRKRAK